MKTIFCYYRISNIMNYTYWVFFCVIFIGFYSCKKDAPSTAVDIGYNYYPNNVGSWIIYDVDSIVWDDFNAPVIEIDSFTYQIKEINESVFMDSEGRETMRIERYKRDDATNPWVIKDVWYANKTASNVERVEENIKFIRLIFPVKNGSVWDGNSANINSDWDYQYSEVDMPLVMGGISFDSTLIVNQRDDNLGIIYDYYKEIYAINVGLIYKEGTHLEQDIIDPTWANPLKGYDFSMTINSYSN